MQLLIPWWNGLFELHNECLDYNEYCNENEMRFECESVACGPALHTECLDRNCVDMVMFGLFSSVYVCMVWII